MKDPVPFIVSQLEESAGTLRRAAQLVGPGVAEALKVIVSSFQNGGRLLLCGNGGSAADCQHLAAEFTGLLHRERPRPGLSAIALTAEGPLITATANDAGFDHIFERQVEAHGRPGDVLLALSTSGASPNVVRALESARRGRLRTILLTGARPGSASAAVELVIQVPSDATQRIQECHLAIGHTLCALVEQALFGEGTRS